MTSRKQDKESWSGTPSSSAFADVSILEELFPSLGNGDSSTSHFSNQLALLFNTLNSSDDESSSGPSLYNPLQLSPPRLSEIHALATAKLITQTQEAIMQEYNITDFDLHDGDISNIDKIYSVENSDPNHHAVNTGKKTLKDDRSSSSCSLMYEPLGQPVFSCLSEKCSGRLIDTCTSTDGTEHKPQRSSMNNLMTKVQELTTSSKSRGDSYNHFVSASPTKTFGECGSTQAELDDQNSFPLPGQSVALVQEYSEKCQRVPLKSDIVGSGSMRDIKTSFNNVDLMNDCAVSDVKSLVSSPRKRHPDASETISTSCIKKFKNVDETKFDKSQSIKSKCSASVNSDQWKQDNASIHRKQREMDISKLHKNHVQHVSVIVPSSVTTATKNHPQEENGSQDSVLFVCNTCAKGFTCMEDLRKHMAEHQVYPCPYPGCVRMFTYRSHLSYHHHTHMGEKHFQCVECGKLFTKAQHLEVHMRSHSSEKMFQCKQCDRSFHTAGNLKNHERIHSGERPYKCDVSGCFKSFAELSTLKKHKVTHTGERSYRCELCGKCFTQASSRSYHMKKHRELADKPCAIPAHVT